MACRLFDTKPLWWRIINSPIGSKFQWNLNQNTMIFILENEFKNIVCKMSVSSQCDSIQEESCQNLDDFILHYTMGIIVTRVAIFFSRERCVNQLTHWGRVTHIRVGKVLIIGSDNGLAPGRRQAIILTNAGILLIWPLGTNFSEILIEINTFSFKKMHLKMSSGKWRPFVSASMC